MNALTPFLAEVAKVVIGKDEEVKLALCTFFSRGHLLIEDTPGVGKTTLAKTLAQLFSLQFKRIQMTSDLLPSDLLGFQILNPEKGSFDFHPGAVFTQFLLADELNRASPKTQSALLEAMEERRVSIDGKSYDLPRPFFVIATQNPRGGIGTFPLPESQVDRFMMKIHLGPPSSADEVKLIHSFVNNQKEELKPFNENDLMKINEQIQKVQVNERVSQYIVDLLNESRNQAEFVGLSPRSGIDMVKAAQTYAFFEARDYIIPDDIQYLAPFVWGHRLVAAHTNHREQEMKLAKALINSVSVL